MTIKSPGLHRAVQIIRSLLYFALFALIISWIRGAQNMEPWTVLLASVIAVLEAVNLVQQLQTDATARRSRQLESLMLQLRQATGAVNYVEPLIQETTQSERPLSDILEEMAHLVLIGASGTGKTTVLQHKAIELARAHLDDVEGAAQPLPFLVHLAQWRRGQSLKRFLKEQWPYDGDPLDVIAKTRVWFMADGLDELCVDIAQVTQQIRRWLESGLGPYRAIFACRSERYKGEMVLPLPTVEMPATLSGAQIERFATSYLGKDADTFLDAYNSPVPVWAKEVTEGLSLGTPFFLTVLLDAWKLDPDPKAIRNPGMQVDLFLRRIWDHEIGRGSRRRFAFEEMISACADFTKYYEFTELLAAGTGAYSSRNRRDTLRSLASGLMWHAHLQRSKRSRRFHAAQAAVWLVPATIVALGHGILWSIRRSLRHAVMIAETRKQLLSYFFVELRQGLESGFSGIGAMFKELRQRGVRRSIATGWSFWQESYFTNLIGPDFWCARHRANQLLSLLLNARIVREEHAAYLPSMTLVREYMLAQKKRLEGGSDLVVKLGHRDNPHWRRWSRVPNDTQLVLMAGIVPDPEGFISKLALHDPYAATLCVASGIEIGSHTRDLIFMELIEWLSGMIRKEEYDWGLREAYRALQYFSSPSMIEPLLDTVDKFSPYEMTTDIIEIIVDLGRNAVPTLIRRLPPPHDQHYPSSTRVIIICLSRIADPRARAPLTEWASMKTNGRDYAWLLALAAAAHFGEEDLQPLMETYLKNPDRWEGSRFVESWYAYWETAPDRSVALNYLLELLRRNSADHGIGAEFERLLTRRIAFADSINAQLIEAYCAENHTAVKKVIARVLGERKVAEACDVLLADIYDPNLVWTVIPALGKIGCGRPDIVKALVGYLQDQDVGVRWMTLEALGKMNAPTAALPISRLLFDTTTLTHGPRLCEIAASVLSNIDSPIAREKATAYYVDQLEKSTPDSGEWYEIASRLRKLDHRNEDAIDRVRSGMMLKQELTLENVLHG